MSMRQQRGPISNFGGNVCFTPASYYAPTSEAEVLEILDRHARGTIRVIGSLHSWNPAIVSEDVLVDLRYLNSVTIHRHPDGSVSATVGGGCRLKRLLQQLHAQSEHTMPSLGLITEQTIAGAISTATHGSGRHSMSHYVEEVRLAAYDAHTGQARIYVYDQGPELRAARCALGCMGIILSVRLRCAARYDVAETLVPCATIDEALQMERDTPLQQFFLIPHLWSYFVQRRVVVDTPAPRRLSARFYRGYWFFVLDVSFHLMVKLLASVLRRPSLARFFYRKILSPLIIKNHTFVDTSDRMLVMEHELFKHLEIEIFVPAEHIRRAVEYVRGVLEFADGPSSMLPAEIRHALEQIGNIEPAEKLCGRFSHHYPICIRRVLPDDTLISMTAGTEQNWYAISIITYVEPRESFFQLAAFLARSMAQLFRARLHWGKYFPLEKEEVEKAYPLLAEFRRICREIDPHGVFRNDFTRRVLGFDG